MSDVFYTIVRRVGSLAFLVSARATVLHVERSRIAGAYILAANHQSPYDIPLLIRHTPRHLDFVSIVEVFRHWFPRWFYGSMNAFPIDRSKPDRRGVRTIVDRLSRGRAIAIFPEGRLRKPEDSVIHGGPMKPGAGRLAHMASAPVLPCVIINSTAYQKLVAWLPIRRVRYGLNYGQPISLRKDLDKGAAAQQLEDDLRLSLISLYNELVEEMKKRK